MGTKLKVPSISETLLYISFIGILTVVSISSSALPSPAQPAKIIFPILRTHSSSNQSSNANSSFYVNASAVHSNAFNFSSAELNLSDSDSLPTIHNNSITISSATNAPRREISKLPLEKLFSNITTNSSSSTDPTDSDSTPTTTLVPTTTLSYRRKHVSPHPIQKKVKSTFHHIRKANGSSSLETDRIDPVVETRRILRSNSSTTTSTTRPTTTRPTTTTTTTTTTTATPTTQTQPVTQIRKITSTVPPSLRRSNSSSTSFFLLPTSSTTASTVSNNPFIDLRRRTNDTQATESSSTTEMSSTTPDPEDVIRRALLNHTLMHGAEEDLDRLVFSQLPEGSKLILRSVKIVKTDENGDTIEDEDDDAATAWDVTIANVTDSLYDAEEVRNAGEEEDDEEDSEEDDHHAELPRSNKNLNKNDLLSSGSHESHATANYNAYGANHKQKERSKNYHHGNDHGKHHKKTNTDTDGVKVNNYHGKEKGLTDFANSHGNAQSNEGGRYKDSKKKNKGRKVTGFKRVYHKEEFQRTEHFYDDEEAKRIAENYSMNDHKDKANHGNKEDDRKFHGVRTDYVDGNKVKNEYATKNGYNKGQHESNTDAEKHAQSNHHGNTKNMRYSSPQANNYHSTEDKNYHPNHNYKAAYSNESPILRAIPTSASMPSNDRSNHIRKLEATPAVTSFTVTEYIQPDSTEDSIVVSHSLPSISDSLSDLGDDSQPTFAPTAAESLGKPEEMKLFFSPRERHIPLENEIPSEGTPYAPNFGPATQKTLIPTEIPFRHSHSHYRGGPNRPRLALTGSGYDGGHLRFMDTPFFNKMGNATATIQVQEGNVVDNSLHHDKGNNQNNNINNMNNDFDNRYANNYQTTMRNNNNDGIIIDPVPAVYSTIVKVMPKQFYNYTDFHNKAASSIVPPDSNVISIDKANVNEIVLTTPPPHHRGHRNQFHPSGHGNWNGIHENEQESQNHPNHNYGQDPSQRFRGPRKRIPPAHLARLHHRRRNRPMTHLQNHPGPNGPPQNIYNNKNTLPLTGQGPAGQPSNAVLYKSRRPPGPSFVNGIMDSVANFFSKIG